MTPGDVGVPMKTGGSGISDAVAYSDHSLDVLVFVAGNGVGRFP